MSRFAVVGATSWGVTLATLLSRNGHEVTLVVRHAAEVEAIQADHGLDRLPGLPLPGSVAVVSADGLGSGFGGILIAVPAQAVRPTIAILPDWFQPTVLSAAKGIESGTGARMSEVIGERWPEASLAVLSGPNLSQEIARGMPAAAVVASADIDTARLWQGALSGRRFRGYRTNDVIGVELAGALKNVVAIAAGVAWGLGLGTNTVAAIMTRGLAEITRLGVAMGANPATFQGLAGVGDLSATCFSPLSRNRQLGELLARGYLPDKALNEIGQVVEGATTAPVAVILARRMGVEMPIAEHVVAALDGSETVIEAMAALLDRPLTTETG